MLQLGDCNALMLRRPLPQRSELTARGVMRSARRPDLLVVQAGAPPLGPVALAAGGDGDG